MVVRIMRHVTYSRKWHAHVHRTIKRRRQGRRPNHYQSLIARTNAMIGGGALDGDPLAQTMAGPFMKWLKGVAERADARGQIDK